MRGINITGALVVLLCNLVVSYNHSIQLFQAGGFTGWMAHVAVVAAETTFILGALNIVVARTRGNPPGAPAILGGLLGVALVSWSNVSAGWEKGITGILLGLATPASLIVAEAILSRAILQQREEQGGETEPVGDHPGGEPGEIPATEEGSTKEPGWIQETGEEIPEESPKEQKAVGDHPGGEPVGDPPKPKRFTQEEIEVMAAQIHKVGDSPTKREIMAKFSISDHYAKKVMKALKALKTQGGMENEKDRKKDRKPARIGDPAHGKQSQQHSNTDDSAERRQVGA